MQRLSTPSRSLLSSMAASPSRWWPPDRSVRRVVARFPGSRSTATQASVNQVKGDGLKPERRHVVPSADDPLHARSHNDTMISLGEQFAITQCRRGATEELTARYGNVHPVSSKDAGTAAVEVNNGKRDVQGTTTGVDGKEDVSRATGFSLCSDGKDDVSEGNELSDGEEFASSWADDENVSSYEDGCPSDYVFSLDAIENSTHRDGSAYKGNRRWQIDYRTPDRNETRLEAMRLSVPTEDCFFKDGICMWHPTSRMLQFFSVHLANIDVDSGLVELYGYIAVRDRLDPLRNYIVNIGRDEPIIVEKGSLIEMDGPKRGIELYGTILIEYDMRVKTGEQEKDDMQVIDGMSVIDDIRTESCHAFTGRIHGDCGAVDVIVSRLDNAVEATVEVDISEAQSNFDLRLGCFISGLHEEIRLFHGAISEPRALRRSVVAVVRGTWMDLKFKVGSAVVCCSFKAINHGCSSQQIQIKCASITVKVTWSCVS